MRFKKSDLHRKRARNKFPCSLLGNGLEINQRFRADDLHRILGCWNSLTEDLKHISLFIVMRQLQMNHSCTSMISVKTKLHREIHIFRDSQSVHLLFLLLLCEHEIQLKLKHLHFIWWGKFVDEQQKIPHSTPPQGYFPRYSHHDWWK